MPELRRNNNVIVLLVGDIAPSTLRNRLYKRRIKRLIESSDLGEVRLLGFREDVDKIYSLSDICVFPFQREEPFGIATAESLSFGKSTFFPKRGGLKEVYEIFGMGNDYDVSDIFRTLASFRDMPPPTPASLYIPDALSFKVYSSEISALLQRL